MLKYLGTIAVLALFGATIHPSSAATAEPKFKAIFSIDKNPSSKPYTPFVATCEIPKLNEAFNPTVLSLPSNANFSVQFWRQPAGSTQDRDAVQFASFEINYKGQNIPQPDRTFVNKRVDDVTLEAGSNMRGPEFYIKITENPRDRTTFLNYEYYCLLSVASDAGGWGGNRPEVFSSNRTRLPGPVVKMESRSYIDFNVPVSTRCNVTLDKLATPPTNLTVQYYVEGYPEHFAKYTVRPNAAVPIFEASRSRDGISTQDDQQSSRTFPAYEAVFTFAQPRNYRPPFVQQLYCIVEYDSVRYKSNSVKVQKSS